MLADGIHELVGVTVDAQVDHLEASALQHHCHQILADVVDIALDSADDHCANARHTGFGEERAQHFHARLHGVGRHQHLGNEKDAVAKVNAHDVHTCDEAAVQNFLG